MKAFKTLSVTGILKYVIILSFILFIVYSVSSFQDATPKDLQRTRIDFEYFNNADKTKTLKATLYYVKDRVRTPLTKEKIFFYLGNINPDNLLDSATTDNEGVAQLNFDSTFKFPADKERFVLLTVQFKGNDSFMEISKNIHIKEIFMELFLTEIDLTKTILVRAYELGNDNEMYPVNHGKISFYVPRLFGDQLIGESDFEEGKISIGFPEDIAGDSIGNISISARIEEDNDYGNVERNIAHFRWGNKKPIEEHKSVLTIQITIPSRGLWNTNAPLWMIITLIILMIGVWSHYFFVIFQLIKLARLRKKKN